MTTRLAPAPDARRREEPAKAWTYEFRVFPQKDNSLHCAHCDREFEPGYHEQCCVSYPSAEIAEQVGLDHDQYHNEGGKKRVVAFCRPVKAEAP